MFYFYLVLFIPEIWQLWSLFEWNWDWVPMVPSTFQGHSGSECLFLLDSLSQPPWKDPLFYLARFSPDIFFSNSCFLSCVWFPSPFQLTWSPRFYFLGLFSFRLSKEIKIFVFSIQGSLALHAYLIFGLYVCISKNHTNVSCSPRFIYPSVLTRVSKFWVFSSFSIIYFKWIRILLSSWYEL